VRLFKGAEFNAVDEDGVGNLDMKTLCITFVEFPGK